MFDYIIIGAGFAGSVIAERIASKLKKRVLVIDRRPHIGGNCYDYKHHNNVIVHKYGPHLFHTNDKKVFSYLSQFTDWREYQHQVLAYVDGQKIPLPFNLNSLYMVFPHFMAKKIERKLLSKYSYNTKIPILELRKVKDEDIQFLAEYIYKKIFLNYTAKQWGLKPEEIDIKVTARVPVFVGRDNRYFHDKYQAIPREGYTKIFERMLFQPNIHLLLNTDGKQIINLDLDRKKIYFLGKEFNGKVIFTGMIDELFEYCFGHLPYLSLDLQFQTVQKEFFQEVATVNYPNNYNFTRITEFKHIHPTNVSSTVILKEYPKPYRVGQDIPYYPVFVKQNTEKHAKYKELASKFNNLILVGRLAEYKYYDMDDIVKSALEVFENQIK